MARVVIDELGMKRYFNDDSQRHREDGYAVIWTNGNKSSYVNGRCHPFDETKPTITKPNGHRRWHIKGKLVWPKL